MFQVKALQKECVRASLRRPKNLKLKPMETINQEAKIENKENSPNTERGSVLYRSIRRIKKIF
jgi:hypothetical protein